MALVDEVRLALRSDPVIEDIGNGYVEVTTQFLNRRNDMLQYYIRRSGNDFLLTDDGETLDDLAAAGANLKSDELQARILTILNRFGVSNNNGRLEIPAVAHDLPLRQSLLLQAMLVVPASVDL